MGCMDQKDDGEVIDNDEPRATLNLDIDGLLKGVAKAERAMKELEAAGNTPPPVTVAMLLRQWGDERQSIIDVDGHVALRPAALTEGRGE